MVDDEQLLSFLSLVGPENRLRISFRVNKTSNEHPTNLSPTKAQQEFLSSPANQKRTYFTNATRTSDKPGAPQRHYPELGPHLTRAQIISDIADTWIEQAGGGTNAVEMEDIRIAFTTWTDSATLDADNLCLARYNTVASWCGSVQPSELVPILRDIVAHLSDFALAKFYTHARDMANFADSCSSASQGKKLLAASFRAYAVDGFVSRSFLHKGLTGAAALDISADKADSVLASYGDNLNEQDFVEVLTYFVGDDALALHKVLCAAAPQRPHWIGSPRKDAAVTALQEARTRIELRHTLDDMTCEKIVQFTASFLQPQPAASAAVASDRQLSIAAERDSKMRQIIGKGIAWCLACLLQHPSANMSNSGDDENKSRAIISTPEQNDNNNNNNNATLSDESEAAAWAWLRVSTKDAAATENFLLMLRSTERSGASRNALALVAEKLLSVELERSNVLRLSTTASILAHWCLLVCQLTCVVRDVSWPPEFAPSQEDFEQMTVRSPRVDRIVERNTAQSPPRQTEAFQHAGVSPRRIGGSDAVAGGSSSSRKLMLIPSPPGSARPGDSTLTASVDNLHKKAGSRYQPRYNEHKASAFGLTREPPKTLQEALQDAEVTRNAAAGAVMQAQLRATHFLITVNSATGLALAGAGAGGRVYVSVHDASSVDPKNNPEVFRTASVGAVGPSQSFPVAGSRFVAPITGPQMGYVFRVYSGTSFIGAARWHISQVPPPSPAASMMPVEQLALKLYSSQDGVGGGAAGHVAVSISRQRELSYVPAASEEERLCDAMVQVTLIDVSKDKQQQQQQQDDNDNTVYGSTANSDNAYVRGVNNAGDVVFTIKGDGRSAAFDLERAVPYITLQRLEPHVAGDQVTDTVDISATKLVASRAIEETFKPVGRMLEANELPYVVRLNSIGFIEVLSSKKQQPLSASGTGPAPEEEL